MNSCRTLIIPKGTYEFTDFRSNIIDLYKKYHPDKVLSANRVDVFNDKITWDNTYIPPEDALVFSQQGFGFDVSSLIASSNYIIDIPKHVEMFNRYVPIVLKTIRHLGFNVLPVSTRKIKGVKKNIMHAHQDNITIVDPDIEGYNGSTIGDTNFFYHAWDMEWIEGYLIYLYLFKPIMTAKVLWQDRNKIYAMKTNSSGEIKESSNEMYRADMPQAFRGKARPMIEGMPLPSMQLLGELSNMSMALNIPSCEVFLAKRDTKSYVLNVNYTHAPILSELFRFEIKQEIWKRFCEFMRVDEDASKDIDC